MPNGSRGRAAGPRDTARRACWPPREKAVIVRNAIASQRIATPWAAVATAPRRLIRRRNQSWQMTLVRLSPAAGRLIRSSRRIRSQAGLRFSRVNRSPDRPRINSARMTLPPIASPHAVPIAIPVRPRAGNRPPAQRPAARSDRYSPRSSGPSPSSRSWCPRRLAEQALPTVVHARSG